MALLVPVTEVAEEVVKGYGLLLWLAAGAQGYPPSALGRLVVVVDVGRLETT